MAIAETEPRPRQQPYRSRRAHRQRNDWAMRPHQRRRADPDGRQGSGPTITSRSTGAATSRPCTSPAPSTPRSRTTGSTEVYRLVAQINEQLWLGHFDVWTHEGLIMFRHGLMLNGALATDRRSAKPCSRPRSRPASATTRPSSSWSGPARRAARRWPPPCSRPRAGPELVIPAPLVGRLARRSHRTSLRRRPQPMRRANRRR